MYPNVPNEKMDSQLARETSSETWERHVFPMDSSETQAPKLATAAFLAFSCSKACLARSRPASDLEPLAPLMALDGGTAQLLQFPYLGMLGGDPTKSTLQPIHPRFVQFMPLLELHCGKMELEHCIH